MNFASPNSISLKEATILTLGLVVLLLTTHYYLGINGIIGTLTCGIIVLLFPLLQSIKGSFILLYFVASIFILDTRDGIQPIEIPFFGLSVLLILFVGYKAINGSLKLENSLDYLFLMLHFLIPYAVLIGKINGAATYSAFGEVVYFLGLFTYFPLREYLEKESFKKTMGLVILVTLTFVLIRNFVYYRQILAQALLPWQAENARVAANELIVVIGCSLTLATASLTQKKYLQIVCTALFIVFMVSLILTQSRGYWIAGFFSVITIFLVIDKKGKKRILYTATTLCILGFLVANLFFENFLSLIINGLNSRLQSIGSGTADNSLQDRWLESKTVLGHILENPIAGYGLGTEFTRKKIFFDFFIRTSFIHNGYLGATFKFGILGLLSFIFIWFSMIKKSIVLYKHSAKILPLSIVGIVVGMLFVNNSSSQILIFEGVAFTSLAAAYLNTEFEKIN